MRITKHIIAYYLYPLQTGNVLMTIDNVIKKCKLFECVLIIFTIYAANIYYDDNILDTLLSRIDYRCGLFGNCLLTSFYSFWQLRRY